MRRAEQIEKAVESYFAIDGRDVDIKPLGRAYFFAGAFWSDQNPPWRKFPDEKPEKWGEYLVAVLNAPYNEIVVTHAMWSDENEHFYYHLYHYDNHISRQHEIVVFKNILAWMPFPQPPKFIDNNDNKQ